MKTKIYYFIIALMVASCGPTAEEKAKIEQDARNTLLEEQSRATRRMDSIAFVEKEKADAALRIKEKKENLSRIRRRLTDYMAKQNIELRLANDRLREIGGYEFLRTYAEKEQQKRAQLEKIAIIERGIAEIQDAINKIDNNSLSEEEYNDLLSQM